ncbi:MAG: hypothetical protein E6R13_09955 [Spirochaetes bacterium]|nr:MAG: hypothetical protein E6R13_09955 [Spirochaetota bacterium]
MIEVITNITFIFQLKYFNVEFSICAKNTGKIRQITKLRAKDIKCANGIKLKRMYTTIQPVFSQIRQDKTIKNDYILKLEDKKHLSYNIKLFHEVNDKNLKLSYVTSQEYFNTYIDPNESLQEKIKNQLIIYGCQPIFMYSMFNVEWILKPNPYKKLMKKFGYTYDEDGIKQFVYDRNKQFIDNTINTIIEK